jgi:hypothetical protein
MTVRAYKTTVALQNKGNKTELDRDQQAAISGVSGSAGKADIPVRIAEAPDQTVFQNLNSLHVTGQSGPHPDANFQTLGVGPVSYLTERNPKDPETGEETAVSPNSFNDYAASINIHQNANLANVGISQGTRPRIDQETTESSVHISADNTAIEGTANICLVTSRKSVLSKQGNEALNTIGGISLTAGNATNALQAIVKDVPLRDYLNKLSETVQKLADSLHVFAKHQYDLNIELAKHGHPDLLNMICSLSAQQGLKSISNGKTLKNKEVFNTGMKTCENLLKVMSDCEVHRQNVDTYNNAHLAGHGAYIGSQHNKTT